MNRFEKFVFNYSLIFGYNHKNNRNNIKKLIRLKTKKPSMYKVLILNDDFTPMVFVIFILEKIFNITNKNAVSVMLSIHNNGMGICGIFTYEVAETKTQQVLNLAKQHQYPLQCLLEKE